MPQNSKSSISEETNLDGIETASKLKAFVEILDKYFTSGMNKEMTARWGYITNITDENEIIQVMRCPASSYPLLVKLLPLILTNYNCVLILIERGETRVSKVKKRSNKNHIES